MPVDDIYWNAIDFGSEESLHEFQSHSKPYVDPWDLENYAYIKDHLDSVDLNSEPSGSSSGEFAGSSGEFAEANSTSFYYVPGRKKSVPAEVQKYDSILTEQGNYVAIDELKEYERNRLEQELEYETRRIRQKNLDDYYEEPEESPYEMGLYVDHKIPPSTSNMPVSFSKSYRDRSLSFSYGDYGYDPYGTKQDIYSKLDEVPIKKDSTLPIYDDERRSRKKPNNFGLSNYGHLKIDYSYSWNSLNKYICN